MRSRFIFKCQVFKIRNFSAILISGLRANNIDISPYLIKRAMENTAQYQDKVDHFSQGHGLLQVKKYY